MAENINIKILIDAAESAKTVAETRKALKDLKSAALQVEEGSTAFESITKASGQLQDKISDLSATTRFFADDMRNLKGLSSIGEGIAGGFALAQGAAALFGGENKVLEQSLLKVQSAMAILQGLQAVGNVLQKESAASLLITNTARKVAIALTSEQAVAEAAEAVAAGTATVAQRALNAAMNANPIAILVTLILSAVAALTLFSSKSDEATKEEKKRADEIKRANELQKERSEFVAKESSDFTTLIYQLKATNENSTERLDLIKKINDTYGTTLQNLSDENEFQAQLNKTVDEYITLQYNKFKLQKNQEYIDKQNQIMFDAEIKRNKLRNDLLKEQQKGGFTFGDINAIEREGETIDSLNKKIEESRKALEKLGVRRVELTKIENDLTDSGKKYVEQEDKKTKSVKDNTKANDENANSLKLIAETEAFLIDEQLAAESLALDQLTDGYYKRIALLNQEEKEKKLALEREYKRLQVELEKQAELDKKNKEDLLKEKAVLEKKYQEEITNYANYYSDIRKKIIEEENKRILDAARESAKAALTPDEYDRYLEFLKRRFEEKFDLKISSQSFINRLKKDIDGISKDFTDSLNEFKNKIIEDTYFGVKSNTMDALSNVFKLDDTQEKEYFLKLSAFYNDKYNVIKSKEEEINKLRGVDKIPFAVEPGPGQVGLADLSVDENQKITNALIERYGILKEAEEKYYNDSVDNLFKDFDTKKISAEQFNKDFEKLQEKHNDNLLDIDVVYGQASNVQLAERTKTRNEKIIADQKAFAQQMIQIEKDLANAITSIVNQRTDNQISRINQVYDEQLMALSDEFKLWKESQTTRTIAEQQQFDKEQEFDNRKKEIERQKLIEIDKEQRKAFNVQKQMSAIQIMIDTSQAVMKAYAQFGYPLGLISAAAVGSIGAIQIGLVQSQTYQSAFADGGLVMGPGGPKEDKINAKLSNGESVINAKSTKMFAPILSAINQAGGGKAIPSLGSNNMATGGLVTSPMSNSNDDRLINVIENLSDRPIETYVSEREITKSQMKKQRENRRSSF
jgi:hypothetical protein